MNFTHFFVILNVAILVSASNPTYWISKIGNRTSSTTSKPVYDATSSEIQAILDCNVNRTIWECGLDSDLTEHQQFCKRLATNNPSDSEQVQDGPNKFAAFRETWMDMTGSGVFVPTCYNPTEKERQEIEDCFFHRSWRQTPKLATHDTFCKNLQAEKPTATDASNMDRLLAYRKLWAQMPQVGRADYRQILACSALEVYYDALPELLSRECSHYYELVRKPATVRDLRRRQMHNCLDPNSIVGNRKYTCMCRLQTYRQMYYADEE